MLKLQFFLIIGALSLISGCSNQQTYAESLSSRPIPSDSASLQRECTELRAEIARQAALPAVAAGNPYVNPALVAAVSQRNIAQIESRAATIRCPGAFNADHADTQQANPIGQCISACKANTEKTPAQCFESCNH